MDPDLTSAIYSGVIVVGTLTGAVCFGAVAYIMIKEHYQKNKKQQEIKKSQPVEKDNLTGLIEGLNIEPSIDEIKSIDIKVTEKPKPTLDYEGPEHTLNLEKPKQEKPLEERSDLYKKLKGFENKESDIA